MSEQPTEQDKRTPLQRNHRRVVTKLLTVVTIAFVFGFALVPLYDVFCDVTGLNGKTENPEKAGGFNLGGLFQKNKSAPSRIDTSRTVSIEFTSTVMPGLPWDIRPLTPRLELHPGELHQAKFLVRNRSDQTIVGQAVPSVSPGLAAQHFTKLDCFCFTQQTLLPGETKELPLTFIVQPELDKDTHTITLAYAFFKAEKPAPTKP